MVYPPIDECLSCSEGMPIYDHGALTINLSTFRDLATEYLNQVDSFCKESKFYTTSAKDFKETGRCKAK